MTIGPAPMMSTLLMSVRLGTSAAPIRRTSAAPIRRTLALLHHLREAVEQIADVVRPRARLGVPLEAESRPVGAREPLQAAVEERDVSGPQIPGQRAGVDREAVVLAGDDDRPAVEVLHRVVRTVV